MTRRINGAILAAFCAVGACTKKDPAAVRAAPPPDSGAASAPGSTAASSTAASTTAPAGGPPASGSASSGSASSGSASAEASAPPPYDWKPVFAAAFLRAEDLKAPAKTRAPAAAEVADLVRGSPSLRTTAPGAGYPDAQKGHCLVAAMIQQNLEASADAYSFGGSIAVGACSIKLEAIAVPVKTGNVRFFRALACPGGKFEDVARDKPTWARFRQAPELARCADAKTVYVSEQVEATLVIAKQKGGEEQTFKYLSGRVGADGGPCVGTIAAGVVRYQDCADFERIEGAKGVDYVRATYAGDERALADKSGAATATASLQADDWQGAVKAAPAGVQVELQRGDAKTETALGAPPAADSAGTAVRGALRALRRNLQVDPAAEPPPAAPAPPPAVPAPAP